MVDAILRSFRHRKNIRAAIANRGEIDYGTFDLHLLHQINDLSTDIFSTLDYPRLTNPGWFKSSGEEFGFSRLPACFDIYNPHHITSTLPPLSSGGFLGKRLGWNSVPNEVRTHHEKKLFMTEFHKFKVGDKGLDCDAMALAWSKYVDGETIFPKLPHHLEIHKTVYEKARNRDSTMATVADKLLELQHILSVSFLPSPDEERWLLSDPSPLTVPHSSTVPFPVSPKKFFHHVVEPPKAQMEPAVTCQPLAPTTTPVGASNRRARRCTVCALTTCPGARKKALCLTPEELRGSYRSYPRSDRVTLRPKR